MTKKKPPKRGAKRRKPPIVDAIFDPPSNDELLAHLRDVRGRWLRAMARKFQCDKVELMLQLGRLVADGDVVAEKHGGTFKYTATAPATDREATVIHRLRVELDQALANNRLLLEQLQKAELAAGQEVPMKLVHKNKWQRRMVSQLGGALIRWAACTSEAAAFAALADLNHLYEQIKDARALRGQKAKKKP